MKMCTNVYRSVAAQRSCLPNLYMPVHLEPIAKCGSWLRLATTRNLSLALLAPTSGNMCRNLSCSCVVLPAQHAGLAEIPATTGPQLANAGAETITQTRSSSSMHLSAFGFKCRLPPYRNAACSSRVETQAQAFHLSTRCRKSTRDTADRMTIYQKWQVGV